MNSCYYVDKKTIAKGMLFFYLNPIHHYLLQIK